MHLYKSFPPKDSAQFKEDFRRDHKLCYSNEKSLPVFTLSQILLVSESHSLEIYCGVNSARLRNVLLPNNC